MNSANGVLSFVQGRPGIGREKQTIKNTSSRLLSLDRDSVSPRSGTLFAASAKVTEGLILPAVGLFWTSVQEASSSAQKLLHSRTQLGPPLLQRWKKTLKEEHSKERKLTT
jgi:hypothetical protein